MRKLIIGIALIMCAITASSQVPPFVGFTPVPQTPSTQTNSLNAIQMYELERMAQAQRLVAQSRAAQNETETKRDVLIAIGEMKQYIINALSQNIDETLRMQLNKDYGMLSEIAANVQKYGLKNEYIDKLLWVSDDINNNIVNFINRVAVAPDVQEAEAKPQEWTGTGFALNNGYVVTNYHVVEDAETINISGVNGNFAIAYTAYVVATDKANDLAIIKINDSRFNGFGVLPYTVETRMAEVGDNIFVLGFPLTQTMGDEIKLTNGIISSRTGFQGNASLYQMTAPIQPGNSGSPMFNIKGNVVGIVCAHHNGAENVGYAIKTSYLKNLAESSSLTDIFPQRNTIATLPLSGQVKKLKSFVYFIKCTNKGTNSQTSNSSRVKTIQNPSVFSKNTQSFTVTSVCLSDSYTAIKIKCTVMNYIWLSISNKTYILANGKRYHIQYTNGIDISSKESYFNEDVTFTLYFPPIPTDIQQIDLIDPNDSRWFIGGIKLQ